MKKSTRFIRKRASTSTRSRRSGSDRHIARVAKSVLLHNAESKYFYVNSGGALTFNALGNTFPLSNITQGTSDNQRIGDQVRLQQIIIRTRVIGIATTGNVIRVIIWRWKPINSASVPVTQNILYDSVGSDYLTAMSAIDPKTVPSQAVILKDLYHKQYTTSSTCPSGGVYKINLRNAEQVYTGSFSTNQIFLTVVGQSAGSTCTIVYSSEIRFTDI